MSKPKAEFRLTPLVEESCQDCPLQKSDEVDRQVTTEFYPKSEGPNRVDVMFVAEAPGATENQRGRPAVGRTGRLLRRVVQRTSGGQQVSVAYGNLVRCRPTKENKTYDVVDRPPTPRETKCCRGNILRDIQKLRPKVLVVLGESAARSLVHNRDGTALDQKTKISALRGKDFIVKLPDGTEVPCIVTYHFSHVYRTPGIASVFREDVGKAIRRVRGELSDYSVRGKPTRLIDTVPKVKKFLSHMIKDLTKDDIVAFDYETKGLARFDNDVLCVSFAYRADQAYVIPLKHRETPFSGAEIRQVMKLLRKFFRVRNPSFKALVPHNLKFEALSTLDQFGTHILMPTADTFQRAHALNEDRKDSVNFPYGLKTLSEDQLGFYHYDAHEIVRVLRLMREGRIAEASLVDITEYNGMDSYVGFRLYRWQDEWAVAEGYDEFEIISHKLHGPVGRFLAEMERNGLLADRERVQDLMSDDSEIRARMDAILKELYGLESVQEANRQLLGQKNMSGGLWAERDALWVFKVGATEAKRILFFDVLDLDPAEYSKKTRAPSVGKALFERYKGVLEIDLYQEYTQLQKIMSTYVKSIHKFIHTDPDMMRDGRVRPHFKPTGTVTGRISSANPNMLNIPSRSKTAAAKAIKQLYIVPEGYVLICADYSQAEVRWLAEATKDPLLVKAFVDSYEAKRICRMDPTPENRRRSSLEGDFHRHTASMINSVELSEVTDDQRTAAKAIMFGLVYGMSIQGLASRLKISTLRAQEFIDIFFAQFPIAKQWLDQMEKEGFRNGYVLSPTGRRKLINSWLFVGDEDYSNLPRYLSHIRGHINHEMRVCRNAPIQGVASDTNLLACNDLLMHILDNKLDWKIINTVYDSIMIEVPFPEAKLCIETAQTIMEDPDLFSEFGLKPQVPFAADFSVGLNWGDQFDVAYDKEKWTVRCGECGVTRTEDHRPINRRCEECGSPRVRRSIVEGPLDQLLRQIDKDHQLSCMWG
ncbi:hypothetical protein LCGC14_0769510 [marine sediment metagenome]|uniref:DNA-directed DNA polymerase n=1 Tax=marine sediment metagenome TaxID=412755 RepID=A0A0F9Q2X0_9ZZZZ